MEKYKTMKDTLVAQVQAQLGNLQEVDAKELGEVVDMIKDLEEAMYYCSIVKAMEEEPYSMKMIGWSDDADIEHKMLHMEADKKDHSE